MALKAFEKALKKIQEGLATFFGKVVAFVLLVHFAAVFMLVLFSSSVFQKPVANKKKVAVTQVFLQPKKNSASEGKIATLQEAKKLEKTAISSSQGKVEQKIEKTSKKTAVSEKSAEKKENQKKVKPVKSVQEKKQSPKESLVKTARKEGAKEKAKEKIAEAKQALSSSASFASLPKDAHMPIASLSSASSSFAAESSFGGAATACAEDIVAEKMRTFLTLPEHGSVQIELTLSGQGEIEKIVIAQADSEKNRRYVEKSLKGMQFFEVASLLRGKRQTLLLLLTSK